MSRNLSAFGSQITHFNGRQRRVKEPFKWFTAIGQSSVKVLPRDFLRMVDIKNLVAFDEKKIGGPAKKRPVVKVLESGPTGDVYFPRSKDIGSKKESITQIRHPKHGRHDGINQCSINKEGWIVLEPCYIAGGQVKFNCTQETLLLTLQPAIERAFPFWSKCE